MIVAIHQPNYLPWIGYFYKVSQADTFVLLDDVQYTKNSFINRNRIRGSQGEQWLTVPVNVSGKMGQRIDQVQISQVERTMKKLLRTVEQNYQKAPFFNSYYPTFKSIHENSNGSLCELNVQLINWVLALAKIETKVVLSSQLDGVTGVSTSRLVSICKVLSATDYYSGKGGDNYQDHEAFETQGINLIISNFSHPVYPQHGYGFLPNLSVIDLVFNAGTSAGEYIKFSNHRH